jgi:hypothetical protein
MASNTLPFKASTKAKTAAPSTAGAYQSYLAAQQAAQGAGGGYSPSTIVRRPVGGWGSSYLSTGPSAADLAKQAQQRAEELVMAGTFGRGDAVDNDPRITAALDALNPETVQNTMYGQLTDATAAQAGSQGDMLREQMAQSGIQLNDPAAQARLRAIEASRMQANNAGLGQAAMAGQDAAGRMAQLRLQQMGLANQSYGQGSTMLAQKQFGQRQVSAGYSQAVPTYSAAPAQPPAWSAPAWSAPAAGGATPASPYTPYPNTPAAKPATPGQEQEMAHAADPRTVRRANPLKPYR